LTPLKALSSPAALVTTIETLRKRRKILKKRKTGCTISSEEEKDKALVEVHE
jgi:hypothetical protein